MATWRANNLGAGMTLAPEMSGGVQKTFTHDGTTYKLWNLTTPAGTVEETQVSTANQPVDTGGLLKTVDFLPILKYHATYPAGYNDPSYPNNAVPAGTPPPAQL